MRFDDLIQINKAPDQPEIAEREPVQTSVGASVSEDVANSGLVQAFFGARKTVSGIKTSRRGFLKASGIATLAATLTSGLTAWGPAKKVAAQTGIVGTYPRRVMQYCPPYNSDDNCQPGCGSSPICSDCCTSDGWFRNDPKNGYSLYPGGCGDGDIADAWLWRYNGVCGNCSTIEYRCSDGYVATDLGPAPFICRWVTECVPLAEGQEPGEKLPDAAQATNWDPAGALELASENRSFVTIKGWVSDGGPPLDIRVVANDTIVSVGKAQVARPDVAQRVRGANPNCGFQVTFTMIEGPAKICVDALKGNSVSRVGCININIGDDQTVAGSGQSGSISAPRPTATPAGSGQDQDSGTVEPTPSPTSTSQDDSAETETSTDQDSTETRDGTDAQAITASAVIAISELPKDTGAKATAFGMVEVLYSDEDNKGFVSGWASDPASGELPYIEIVRGEEIIGVTVPSLSRPDVASALTRTPNNCGYAYTFDLGEIAQDDDKDTKICVNAVSAKTGARTKLSCSDLSSLASAKAQSESTSRTDSTPSAPDTGVAISETGAAKTGVIYAKVTDARIQSSANGHAVVITGFAYDPNDHADVISVTASHGDQSQSALADSSPSLGALARGVKSPAGFTITLDLPSGQQSVALSAKSKTAQVSFAPLSVNIP